MSSSNKPENTAMMTVSPVYQTAEERLPHVFSVSNWTAVIMEQTTISNWGLSSSEFISIVWPLLQNGEEQNVFCKKKTLTNLEKNKRIQLASVCNELSFEDIFYWFCHLSQRQFVRGLEQDNNETSETL